jgi:hypothetical protein
MEYGNNMIFAIINEISMGIWNFLTHMMKFSGKSRDFS